MDAIVGTEQPEPVRAAAATGQPPVARPWDTERPGGMGVLERDECLRLLAGAPVGRLAVTRGALPLVLPVSFRLADDRIFFRVVCGSKLDAATRGSVVAFETDDIDPTSMAGWSVLVVGFARDALESDCPADLAAAGVPWARPGSRHRIVALSTDVISGRRVGDGPPPGLA